MTTHERDNWLASMTWQVDFYLRSNRTRRADPEFEWVPYERTHHGPAGLRRMAKQLLRKVGLRPSSSLSPAWLHAHAAQLWQTRQMFADDLSKLLFDASLVVRMTDHRRFYFPRIDFDDLLEFAEIEPFQAEGFPHDYIGMPLGVFDVLLRNRVDPPTLKIITRRIQLQLVNSYRQYLVRRNGFDIAPRPGDVVYDCGACVTHSVEPNVLMADGPAVRKR